ncbi:MAG: adenosylmethionine decarboxylase [Candidatus Thorarchaeota archaeon]|jgi:S-adenosylmethionine decarboxylase proenzyme
MADSSTNPQWEVVLTQVAKKADLAEGSEGARSVLVTMFRNEGINNKKLSQKTGIAVPALAAVRGEMHKARILEDTRSLGSSGRKWVKDNLHLTFDFEPIPLKYKITSSEIPERLAKLERMREILEKRPSPDYALDQSRATYETVIKRTLYLLARGDLEGRRVIFLGDDDAISLAVALTCLPTNVTVLDIDSRVTEFLRETVDEFGLNNFEVLEHDLREPCPDETVGAFDVVVTDPPYTVPGLRLFLKRSRQVLRSRVLTPLGEIETVGKRCLLSFGSKPPLESQLVQLSILGHGFTIQEMVPDFNHYQGARILGQFSHLYYLQTATSPGREVSFEYQGRPLYTRQVKESDIDFRPVGFHIVGELFGLDRQTLLDNELIRESLLESLESANLDVVDVFQHRFDPYGYTVVAILKSSHASVHTWPEHGYAGVDIFLCNDVELGLKAMESMKEKLSPKESDVRWMARGSETTN